MPIPQFPTLVTRAQKGAALLDAEMDANWTNIRAYCLTLANLLSSSVNPDGSLVGNSVGSEAIQAAAVTLAAINPSLLYSIVPVDTDIGTFNSYAITARGGAGGSNLVPGGATYDVNGNYVLTGLTPNYGYFWTQTNPSFDFGVTVNSATSLSASGAFTAILTSVTLTGQPGHAVTATVLQSAPISSYKAGQMFFVWTARTNTGTATLNVNNIGAVPILLDGQPLQYGNIQGGSLFVVVYMNGAFNLFGGGGSSSSASSVTSLNFTINGTTLFSSGQLPFPAGVVSLNHGLGVVPNAVSVVLQKTASDATDGTISIGQSVPLGEFEIVGTGVAFVVSYDTNVITVTPTAGTVSLGGVNITTASWGLVINATKQTNVTNTVLPALDYVDSNPSGAISYNGFLLAWNHNSASGKVNGRAINLTNNETTLITAPSGGVQPDSVNAALFTRASGNVDIVFTSNAGVFRMAAVNPNSNLIPQAQFYGANQIYGPQAITTTSSYTLTPGTNEIAYSLDGVTYTNFTGVAVTIPTSNSGNLYLKGNANGLVTASLVLAGGTGFSAWQPVAITTAITGQYPRKPVWIVEAGGSITDVYVASSGMSANNPINSVPMFHITNTGSSTNIGSVDFTNSNIVGVSAFNSIYSNNNGSALVSFLAYNPFNKRIYVMTNTSGLLHIFQITGSYGSGGNDISTWWVSSTPGRYTNLTYVKSMSIPGSGNYFSNADRCYMSIEINQQTGNETAIIFTRGGNGSNYGSITRLPWVE